MKKEAKKVYEEYCKKYNLNFRTIKMVADHYLYLGEQIIATLTPERIKKEVAKEMKKQREAEAQGKIYMIDPSFTEYLLVAVRGLYEIPYEHRYDILKEML